MKISVRDRGAIGDGVADDTAAFASALASCDATTTKIGPQTIQGGGIVEVPAGSYRLTAPLMLHRRVSLRGEGESSALVWDWPAQANDRTGLVLDSGYVQSQQSVRVSDLVCHSLSGGTGFHARGGVASSVERVGFGGWDTCVVLEASNLMHLDRLICSSWAGVGVQAQIGVRFALRESLGGGATNANTVSRSQLNGCAVGVLHEDGAGNVIESCNLNACGDALRFLGSQGTTVRDCLAEGTLGAFLRAGPPGGYPQGARVCWQRLAVRDCVITVPAASLLEYHELGCSGYDTDWSGTRVLGGRPDGAGGDLGAIDGAWTYVLLAGKWTPPAFYQGGSVHAVRAGAGSRGLWARPPYGFQP